jgi:hypothetical protein
MWPTGCTTGWIFYIFDAIGCPNIWTTDCINDSKYVNYINATFSTTASVRTEHSEVIDDVINCEKLSV